ncbi:MAG: putative GIY-YIG superfamily endonuclease [Halieaceae bacterium]|jgi:predicted GIY-YIG superfamily endonuclease
MSKKPNSWDRLSILSDAKKYTSLTTWNKKSVGAVQAAKRLGIYDEATEHMPRKQKSWPKKLVLAEAKKYSTRSEWAKNSSGSLDAARRLNCLDEATRHMKVLRRVRSEDELFSDARKYRTRSAWQKNSGSAYNKARLKGILDQCCAHMEAPTYPNGYWTKERLHESALKYETKRDWRAGEYKAYTSAHQKGLADELTSHMAPMRTMWSKEMVLADARKYRTRKEWRSASPRAQGASLKNDWYDDATTHMTRLGSRHWRCIYLITVRGTKLAYVGLSYNVEKRFSQHLRTKRFLKIAEKYGLDSISVKTLTDFLPVNEAADMERQLIDEYEKKGYQLLNAATGGGTGGNDIRWTKKRTLGEAQKYTSKIQWRQESKNSYDAAYLKGWLDEISAHMDSARGYFTKNEIIDDARRYKTKSDWKRHSPRHSRQAKEKCWFEEATSHMVRPKRKLKWTKEALIADAHKYKTKKEWSANSRAAYSTAHRAGCFKEATAHMPDKIISNQYLKDK